MGELLDTLSYSDLPVIIDCTRKRTVCELSGGAIRPFAETTAGKGEAEQKGSAA